MSKSNNTGLTLIELLVVIAIIGLLIALIVPAIQAAREAARATTCKNNLKQIGLGVIDYSASNGDSLPASWRTIRDRDGKDSETAKDTYDRYSFSWRTTILPFIEQQGLHDQLDFRLTPMDPVNQSAVGVIVTGFQCPSTLDSPRSFKFVGSDSIMGANDYVHVNYVGKHEAGIDQIGTIEGFAGAWYGLTQYTQTSALGPGKMPGARARAPLTRITDGLSNTILVAEKAGYPFLYYADGTQRHPKQWGEGAWASCEIGGFGKAPINWSNFPSIYSFHPSGAHVVMCDGSVRLMKQDTSLDVIVQFLSRDGEDSGSD